MHDLELVNLIIKVLGVPKVNLYRQHFFTYHFESEVFVNHHVLWLEVSVHDVTRVDLIQGLYQLRRETTRQLRLELFLYRKQLAERSVLAMLKNKEKLVAFFKLRVQFDDEGLAPKFFKNFAFANNCFFFVELEDLRDVQVLDGDDAAGLFFAGKVHVTE